MCVTFARGAALELFRQPHPCRHDRCSYLFALAVNTPWKPALSIIRDWVDTCDWRMYLSIGAARSKDLLQPRTSSAGEA